MKLQRWWWLSYPLPPAGPLLAQNTIHYTLQNITNHLYHNYAAVVESAEPVRKMSGPVRLPSVRILIQTALRRVLSSTDPTAIMLSGGSWSSIQVSQRTLPRSSPLLQHLPATSTQISVWIFKFLSLSHCVLYREDSDGPLQAVSLSPRPGFWTIAVQGRCLTGSSLQGQGSFRAMATGYARAGHHCSLAVVLVVVVGLYRESAWGSATLLSCNEAQASPTRGCPHAMVPHTSNSVPECVAPAL